MRKILSRLVTSYFVLLTGLMAGSCGGGTCPELETSELPRYPLESGVYESLDHYGGELVQGEPAWATVEIDRDARTAKIRYRTRDGYRIEENYTFDEPQLERASSY